MSLNLDRMSKIDLKSIKSEDITFNCLDGLDLNFMPKSTEFDRVFSTIDKRAPCIVENININNLISMDCDSNKMRLCNNIQQCKKCYERSFSSHPKAKLWSSLNEKKPREVTKGSDKKMIFNCDKCPHAFKKAVNAFKKAGGCIFCAHQELCDDNFCEMCFNNSFASSVHAKKWSPLNELTARQVFKRSNIEHYLYCDKCKHTDLIKLSNHSGCSYCYHMKFCDNKSCEFCYDRSFAPHEKAKYWSLKNTETPDRVSVGSHDYYLFDCPTCKHEISQCPLSISKGQWCKYCSSRSKELCERDCDHCHKRSFASHPCAKYWSLNNTISPRNVYKNSNTKYLFNCQHCSSEFSFAPNWCKVFSSCIDCRNKTQYLIYKYLSQRYKTIREAKFEWCKTKNFYLPYDFVLEDYKIIIELDGSQHFSECLFTDNLDESISKDNMKMVRAIKKGYTFIRISQDDIWRGRLNLDDCITPNIKKYDTPRVLFISSKENTYENHYTKFMEESELFDIDPDNIDVNFIN